MYLLELVTFLVLFAVASIVATALTEPGEREEEERPLSLAERRASRAAQVHMDEFAKDATLSSVPWLNQQLQRLELAPRIRVFIAQASLEWTLGRLLLTCLFSSMLTLLLAQYRFHSVEFALALSTLAGFLPLGYVYLKRKQRFAKFEEELPQALDMIVNALRAGHSFNAAMGLAVQECDEPVKSEFRICFEEQNYGLTLRTALGNMLERIPMPDLRIAATAILIQKETGGNLAEVLGKCSQVLRERFRLQRDIRVRTAHGRITGWVISSLPLALLIILYLLNPKMESVLWTTDTGIRLLWAAAGMMILGILAIRKLMNIDI